MTAQHIYEFKKISLKVIALQKPTVNSKPIDTNHQLNMQFLEIKAARYFEKLIENFQLCEEHIHTQLLIPIDAKLK